MALQQLYDSLSPLGFYCSIVGVAFLLGLLMGWCLWWWKARQLQQTQELSNAASTEVDQLREANKELAGRVEQAEQMSRSAAASDQHQSDQRHGKTQSGINAAWVPLDESVALEPLSFADNDLAQTNWSRMDGVDDKLSAELGILGVRNEQQVRSLSPDQRRIFDAKLASKGLRWPWSEGDSGFQSASEKIGEAGLAMPDSELPDSGIAGAEIAGAEIAGAGVAAGIAAAAGLVGLGHEDSETQRLTSGDSAAVAAMLHSPDVVGDKLDWSKVDGVSPEMAEELGRLGIANPSHVDAMSPEQKTVFDAALASKGLSWSGELKQSMGISHGQSQPERQHAEDTVTSFSDDDHLEDNLAPSQSKDFARTQSQGHSAAADRGAMADAESAAVAAMLHLPDVEGPEVDWSIVDGVQPEMAKELQRLGVKNSAHVESFSDEQRQVFNAALATKGLSWDDSVASGVTSAVNVSTDEVKDLASPSSSVVLSVAKKNQGSWFSNSFLSSSRSLQAPPNFPPKEHRLNDQTSGTLMSDAFDADTAQLVATMELPAASGEKTKWDAIDGIDAACAKELERLRIHNGEQLNSLSPGERARLQQHLAARGVMIDVDQLVARVSTPGSSQEASQSGSTESASGGARISGFSSATELSDDRSSPTGQGLADNDGYSTQRLSDLAGRDATQGAHEDPSKIPVFSTVIPHVKDDLTLLDGINAIEAEELHQMGIHNFDQLHNLCDDDRHRLKAWFRRRGWYLDMDQWRIASEGNTLNPTLEDIQKKAFEIYQYRDREGRHGAENTDWEQAEWCLRGNPIFDYGVPHRVDYFVEAVDGITPSACDELYRMGLYNLQQIQSLDLESRRLLTRWFAGPRFKVDLTSAFGWLSSLETVPQDKDFGFVFNQRPDQIDDLSDINGIGPATERDLNRIGIYHFNQIAHWSDANVEAIRDTLNLGDRIEKDMWVVQAQRLSGRTN